MGFLINDFEQVKQHLNLSEKAWYIIDQDVKNFYLDKKSESRDGLINRVISNFYEVANASISIRYNNKIDEMTKMFSLSQYDNIDKSIKDYITKNISEMYKDSLLRQVKTYKKGIGKKIGIHVSNVELLKNDVSEDEIYEGNLGFYLKSLLEEYCLLQTYEREKIFFKDKIDEINKALRYQKKLKISIKEKFSLKNNDYFVRKFYVSPYKIVQDSTGSYNYLIGLSEEILKDNSISDKKIASFRISRIDKIMMCQSMNSFISKDRKENIEKDLLEKLPQFMAGDIKDIKVRFTKKGYENYKRLLYLRPNFYKKVEDEELTYIFKCTEVQAMNYFLKFVRDVEIIEPLELRNKFIARYRDALGVYKEEQ